MAGGGGGDSLSLEQTPTWAVALVCFAFVLISIIIEESIHRIGKWLLRHHKKALYEALEKLKSELMLVGFISLLLTVGEGPVSKICISKRLSETMLPCKKKDVAKNADASHSKGENADTSHSTGENHGKLLWEAMSSTHRALLRRILAADGTGSNGYCSKKGRAPLVSQDGMHQLHIFIFILAVFHVLYSVLTMALGRAKMRRWGIWEQETESLEYQLSHDPARFRYAHETSFIRHHASFWNRSPILLWIASFFRQFFSSMTKVDYLTMRHGFITAHLAPHSKFDFHKYIERSLDDDFKVVVGISPPLWAFGVIFLLLNVHGWQTYFWLSFVPLIIILLVGTKLQVIIAEMAAEIQNKHAVVKGSPVVQPNDKLFWFGHPRWILFLIHFTLFQNAFQLAFFSWIWYEFGLRSCFHENFAVIIVRVTMGVGVQILCSYITLPLYALVTQMGSHMKAAIFNEQTANAVKRWHQAAKKNKKQHRKMDLSSGFRSRETTPSQGSSPIHLLHRYKTMGDFDRAQPSERFYHSEYEMSDLEMDASPPPIEHSNSSKTTKGKEKLDATGQQSTAEDVDNYSKDFSFARL